MFINAVKVVCSQLSPLPVRAASTGGLRKFSRRSIAPALLPVAKMAADVSSAPASPLRQRQPGVDAMLRELGAPPADGVPPTTDSFMNRTVTPASLMPGILVLAIEWPVVQP